MNDKHTAKLEYAVSIYSAELWRSLARPLLSWVREALRLARPYFQSMVLARAFEREKLFLSQVLGAVRRPPVPDVSSFFDKLAGHIALGAGFLRNDPRLPDLIRYTRELLERQVLTTWNNFLNPLTLARRIINLKALGKSYTETVKMVALSYRKSFYSAERIVRTGYNGGANYANYRTLLEEGIETHRWLSAKDSRVRRPPKSAANHKEMDGQVVRVGQPFLTSRGYQLLFPGDFSLNAPLDELINCRCTTIAKL